MNDAGLYLLGADQTGIAAEATLAFAQSRACTGVTDSGGGVLTAAPGRYLILHSAHFARTAGSGGWAASIPTLRPSSADRSPLGVGARHPFMDAGTVLCGTTGPAPGLLVNTAQQTLGVRALPSTGLTISAIANYSWLAALLLDGPFKGVGLHGLSAAQTGINAANAQVVWNQTKRACPSVSLSSGAFTFSNQSGLYVALASWAPGRTSGTGTNIALRWTTDPTSGGTTPFSPAGMTRSHTGDSSGAGSNAGAIAIVDTSGGAVTIGTNIESIAATTTFQACVYSKVDIWKLT
jgi:hypothetical protein